MLRKNPLQPPRPPADSGLPVAGGPTAGEPGFLTAEDFDGTGIMVGVDVSESRYWWMPELYGPDESAAAGPAQAASGSGTLTSAAA